MRDVEERPRLRRSRIEVDPDVHAPQMHVTRHAEDPKRPVDTTVARRRQRLDAGRRARIVSELLVAEVEEAEGNQRGVRAVLPRLLLNCDVARAELRMDTARARQLDRRRDQDRVQRRQRCAVGRDETENGARSIALRQVDEVVMHLHHDCRAGVEDNAGLGRCVVRHVTGDPGADPLRRAEPVTAGGVGTWMRLGEPWPAEARPAVAAGLAVQPPRASAALSPAASNRITWWTMLARCGLTTALVTYMSWARCGSSRKQW